MKTKFISSFAALIMSISSYSQIKIFPGGNINIGNTSNPVTSSKVQIIGHATFLSSNSTITSAAHIRGNNAYSGASTPDFTWWGNDVTGIFHPAANVIGISTNGSERMQFYSNGYTYIGTTPRTSAMWTDGQLTIGNPTVNDHCLIIKHDANTGGKAAVVSELNNANSETYNVYYNNGWTFKVLGDGSVFYKYGWLTSDKKLKEDIKTIEKPLEKLLALRGVTYKYKEEAAHPETYGVPRTSMGVIAQEVEQVLPEAVRDFEGTKAVAYQNLISLCIEAIKEQNAQITKFQSDLDNCCSSSQNRIITPPQNAEENPEGITTGSYIKQNSPNPFNKETVIEYFVAEKNTTSSLLVFDMNGKLLKTYKLTGTGKGSLTISGNEFAPGMYYYSLIVNAKEVGTKKMILTE